MIMQLVVQLSVLIQTKMQHFTGTSAHTIHLNFPINKFPYVEWNKKKTQERCSRQRERQRARQPPPTYRTECESLKACVPHQLPGPLPNPLMRLDLNYDGGRGVWGPRELNTVFSFFLWR